MYLYAEDLEQFEKDINENFLVKKLEKSFIEKHLKDVNESEKRSWQNSLKKLQTLLTKSNLPKDIYIVLEHTVPKCDNRVDVILFGKNSQNKENIVIIELKQWSNNTVLRADSHSNLLIRMKQDFQERAHPSLQVKGYHKQIEDFLKIFQQDNPPNLSACCYCHEYEKIENDEGIFHKKFTQLTNAYPVFSKNTEADFIKYLQSYLISGAGKNIFNKFNESEIGPNKNIITNLSKLIRGEKLFNMQEDQSVVCDQIFDKTKKRLKNQEKYVFIVEGGPGSGKTAIAIQMLGQILNKLTDKVAYCTGSRAITITIREKLKTENELAVNAIIKYFSNSLKTAEDVLLIDEAHRLRSHNNYSTTQNLILNSRLSIFFIDPHQRILPNEIEGPHIIKQIAENLGVPKKNILEFKLKNQFRCGGSSNYLEWVTNIMGIEKSNTQLDNKIEFKIFQDPAKMYEEIQKRNQENPNSSRMAAGICWPWDPKDKELKNDIKLGNLELPWGGTLDESALLATASFAENRVGCIYTLQGFDLDYIGLIFGNDLVYNPKIKDWEVKIKNSRDRLIKIGDPSEKDLKICLKNVYRTLLTRAHKGVYVYFLDKTTEEHFRRHIPTPPSPDTL